MNVPTNSKALQFSQFGISNLERVALDLGERPAAGMVRVRIEAISINYRDAMMVKGDYNPRIPLPLIPCSDAAGTVVALGEGVTAYKVGDRVCSTMVPAWVENTPPEDVHQSTLGGPAPGVLCELRDFPCLGVVPIPDYLTMEEAACLPVAGLTAYNALIAEAGIGAGSKVLLLGTGGVSIMGLQIAKAVGAEVAITSSSDEKLARAEALGADHLINYRQHPNWEKEVCRLFGRGADAVLEVGGPGTFNRSVRATRPGGIIALIGVLAQASEPANLVRVLMHHIRVQGILVGSRACFLDYCAFLQRQHLHPVIDKVYAGMESAPQALEHLLQGRHFGKLVIKT